MRHEMPGRGARVLLADIGNSRIKWALWQSGRIGPLHAAVHADWSREDFERSMFSGGSARTSGRRRPAPAARASGQLRDSGRLRAPNSSEAPRRTDVTRIMVASVAGAVLNRRFTAAARRTVGVQPEFIATSRSAAGVTTRYREPWRLGVDRFLAVIAAHRLAGGRGACVINAGTTVTIDFVDARGVHRGGAILPGPRLMVWSLMRSTAGIERRARGAPAGSGGRSPRGASLFARSTKAAIWHGALQAAAATADRAFAEARRTFGGRPLLLLTGGAAGELETLIRTRCVRVDDLVLLGVAVYGGLDLR